MAPNSFGASLPTAPSFDDHSNALDTNGGPCPFCRIAEAYTPFDPRSPPSSESGALSPQLTDPNPETHIVLSTQNVISFLDIQPLSRGHLLLCPRRHAPKLTATTSLESCELGFYLKVLSSALSQATGVADWNIVQNNGAAAAQIVPHMHFHIIPRPEIRAQGKWSEKFTMFGRGQRTDLDSEDGGKLAENLRAAVAEVLRTECLIQDASNTKGKL